MTEKIDPLANNAASVMLINAMAMLAPNDFQELFNPQYVDGKCTVDVQLTVNGVVVPFKESVEEGWKQLEASLSDEILKRAKELVSMARLDDVRMALDNAEWRIEAALENAQKEMK